MVDYTARPDEKSNFWDKGVTMQNDLSFSSGNETSTIYLALQDVQIKGVVPGDEARRDVIRLNASKTWKGFTASGNFNYTTRTANTSRSGVYWNVLNTPMQIPLTQYSNWNEDLGKDAAGNQITNWGDINHYYNAYYRNPYEELDALRSESRNDYFTGVISLTQEITKWLKFDVRSAIAPNNNYYQDNTYSRTFSPYGLSMYTLYGRSVSKANIPSSMGTGQGFGWRWTNDFLLSFDNKFNDITLKTVIGATTRDSYSKSTAVSASSLEIPDFFNVKNRVGNPGASSSWSNQRSMGVFGDVTLGYKNFAYVHVSGRNDWTSLLDKTQWSFFYPGVDASLVLTEMAPSLKTDVVSYIKIRGGVAKVGSVNVGNYSLQNTFGVASNFPFGSLSAYTVSNGLNNRYLEPEFTVSKEIGIDLSFLNNRINTSITAYQTNTTNQTVDMSISSATGYSSSKINTGEMLNKGFEFELKTTPISNANWRWDLNFNYAYWYNEVLSVSGDLKEISLGNNVYAIVGESYPTMKVTQFARDPQSGKVIVDAASGTPSIDPLSIIRGQTVPKHLIGIQSNLNWKNFNFAVSADYRGGHIFGAGLYYDLLFTGIGELSGTNARERFVFPNSVISDGAGGYTPNTNITTQDGGVAWWTNTMRNLSYYSVNSADIWKIREVSLSYDVPATALAFTNNTLKGVRVGFVGRNLFMFLPKNNIYADPEFSNTSGNAVGITDSGQTPATRSYGFNVTLTF
jgi:hypothetical protein